MKKHTIWSYDVGDPSEWVDDENKPMLLDDIYELNDEYLDDERMNLDVATDGEIICIADVGLWYGNREGYKLMGCKISNILQSNCNGNCTWYSDGKDICCDEAHHDGTNHYVYRILKGNNHDDQIENAEKLYCGKPINKRRIGSYTKSLLPLVASVYGW